MPARVAYELQEAIATITLDDGKANALSSEMIAEINAALDRAKDDRATVLLTGKAGMFSAGFDMNVLGAGGGTAHKMLFAGFALGERLLSFPAPVVIACSGHALAMGSFLLLAADHRFGTAGPFKIGANEVKIGLTMPFFGLEICRQRLTPAYFQRSVINAEIYRPEEAAIAGFLDQVVPAEELASVARAKATELAKLDRGVHTATKLRARDAALKAIRTAIARDEEIFRDLP